MKKLNPVKLAENVNLYIIPCNIFKTANISIFIPCELDENYTYHALFEQVLKRGTASHPDQRSIEILTQELYGADFSVNVRKYGNKQILSFSMDIADSQYIDTNENLFSSALDFIYEVLFCPATENDLFRQEYVLQEAFNLKQQILSIINDKYSYSKKRLVELMDSGKTYTKCAYGDVNELDNIDFVKLYSVYKDIITNNPIDIFVVGGIDNNKIYSVISKKFNFSDRKALSAYKPDVVLPSKVNYVDEEMDVKQGKLNIGYRTNITADSSDYFKLLVFNGVFGGGDISKLFMNVREKASLCYYANSSVDKFNGILTVCTGIDIQNRQKAYNIIKEQLRAIINGDISDIEIDAAKKDFRTSIKAVNDSSYSIINFYYGNIMAGLDITPEEFMQKIMAVTKDDVALIAAKIYEDTVYFLKNKGDADV